MTDPSPDLLRRFLLGALSADEMDAVGARLIADDAAGDQMAEAEDALIDAYVAGRLGDAERTAFDRVYLATPAHRARVETIRALAERGGVDVLPGVARSGRASAWLAAAAALLLCASGAWWLVNRGGAAAPSGRESASETAAPSPDTLQRDVAAPEAPVVALALSPLVTRGVGGGASVQVGRGVAQVRFLLGGDLPPADALTAEISAVDRDAVRRWPVDDAPTGTEGAARAVTVPVYAVPAGDYVLTLWQGDADMVQRYAFRVLAP